MKIKDVLEAFTNDIVRRHAPSVYNLSDEEEAPIWSVYAGNELIFSKKTESQVSNILKNPLLLNKYGKLTPKKG